MRERLELDDEELPEGVEEEIAEHVRGEEAARFFHDLHPLAAVDQARAVRAIEAWGEQKVVDRFVALARERRDAERERMRRNRKRVAESLAYVTIGTGGAPCPQGPASPEPQKSQEPPRATVLPTEAPPVPDGATESTPGPGEGAPAPQAQTARRARRSRPSSLRPAA